MAATTRVFLAVDIDAALCRRVDAFIDTCRATGAEVSWVASQNLHLTVKFLGDVPDARIPEICGAAKDTARTAAPWELELTGVGAFPHLGRPTTLWIGGAAGSAALGELAARLDNALHPLGFTRESRPFAVHLTFGRIKRASAGLPALKQLLQENAGLAFGRARIDRLTVYASDLQRGGPVYTPLGECPFGG
jgi:RNA 2',3'-cyclic 3'-phosphodiesterase